MDIATFKRRLFEELDSSVDVSSKDYVINVVKDMYKNYIQYFSTKLGTDDVESLYEKFSKDIFPGFADFILNSDHAFGCQAFPEITGYLSVKHGCWLNSLDFINKYNDLYKKDGNVKLCYGFMIHKDDLEKVEKDISNGLVPVGLKVIPHGFIVLSDKEGNKVFDPTIGANKDYHYFFKEVPEEIWKSFKYYYNNPKDWNVNDFADWTSSKIREELSTKAFQSEVGEISIENNTSVQNTDDVNSEEDEISVDNQETDKGDNTKQNAKDDEVPSEQNISGNEDVEDMNNINFENDNFLSNNNEVHESTYSVGKQELHEDTNTAELISDEEILQIIAGIAKEQEETYKTSSMRYALEIASPERDFEQVLTILRSHTPSLPTERDLTVEEKKRLEDQLHSIYKVYVTEKAKPAPVEEDKNMGDIILNRSTDTGEGGVNIVTWNETDELKKLQPVRNFTNSTQSKAMEIMGVVRKSIEKEERQKKAYLSQIKFLTRDGLYGDVTDDIKGDHVERSARAISEYNGYLVTSESLYHGSKDYEISCSFVVPKKLYLDTRCWTSKDSVEKFIEKVVELSKEESNRIISKGNEGKLNKIVDFSNEKISNSTIGELFPKAIVNYDVNGRNLVTVRLHNLKDDVIDLSQNLLKDKDGLIKEKFTTSDGAEIFFSWYTEDSTEKVVNDQELMNGLLELHIPFKILFVGEDAKVNTIFNHNIVSNDVSFGDEEHLDYEIKETESGLEISAVKKTGSNKTNLEEVIKTFMSKVEDKLFMYKVNNNTILISKLDNLQFEKLHEELSADSVMEYVDNIMITVNEAEYKWKLNSNIQPFYKVYKPLKDIDELLFIENEIPEDTKKSLVEILGLVVKSNSVFKYRGVQYSVFGLEKIVEDKNVDSLNRSVRLENNIFLKSNDEFKCISPIESTDSIKVLEKEKQKPFKKDKNLINSLNEFANRIFEEIPPYSVTLKQTINLSDDDFNLYTEFYNAPRDSEERKNLKAELQQRLEPILEVISNMNKSILDKIKQYADDLEKFCKSKSNKFMLEQKEYNPGLAYAKIVRNIDENESIASLNGDISFSSLTPIVSNSIINTLDKYDKQDDASDVLDEIAKDVGEKRLKRLPSDIAKDFNMPLVLNIQQGIESLTLEDIIEGEKAWLSKPGNPDDKVKVGSGTRYVQPTLSFKLVYQDSNPDNNTFEDIKAGSVLKLVFSKEDIDGTGSKKQNLDVNTNPGEDFAERIGKRVSINADTGLLNFEELLTLKDGNNNKYKDWKTYRGDVEGTVFYVSGDEWKYDGQTYHEGDLVTAEYNGFQPRLTLVNDNTVNQKAAEYKQIAKAYAAGQNASQIEIMEVMKYCRSVGLFTDSTEELGDKASITSVNKYNFYKGLTKEKDLGYSVIFNLSGNTFFEDEQGYTAENPEQYISNAGQAVLDTLNSYFLNVAAIVATRDISTFNSNVETLEELSKKFGSLADAVNKFKEEQKELDSENPKKLTSSKLREISENVLGPNYVDYIAKFKAYSDVFKTGGKFERKDFFTKVLGIDGSDENKEELDNLDSASNLIFNTFKSDQTEIMRDFVDFYINDANTYTADIKAQYKRDNKEYIDTPLETKAITYPYLFSVSDFAKKYGVNPMNVLYKAIKNSTTMEEFQDLLKETPTQETLTKCASRLGFYNKNPENEETEDFKNAKVAINIMKIFYDLETKKIEEERAERKAKKELRKLGKSLDTSVLYTQEEQEAMAAGKTFRDLVIDRLGLVSSDLDKEIKERAKVDLIEVAKAALVKYLTTYRETINPNRNQPATQYHIADGNRTQTITKEQPDTIVSITSDRAWFLLGVIAKGKDEQVIINGSERFGNDPLRMLTYWFGLNSTSQNQVGTFLALMTECFRNIVSNKGSQEYQELQSFKDEFIAGDFNLEKILDGLEARSEDYKVGKVGSTDYKKQ